jgi:hypothetical protein
MTQISLLGSRDYMPIDGAAAAQLICPRCRTTGFVRWTVSRDGLWRAKREREVCALSTGFLTIDSNAAEDATIQCAKCQIAAVEQIADGENIPARGS